MSASRDLLRRLGRDLDAAALQALYASVSVDAGTVRQHLGLRRLAWLEAGQERPPRREELDYTADRLIADAAGTVGALGGLAGLGGLLTLPPEAAAWMVSVLRLGQRLAVVYGFDPETERGRMALSRALAAGFEVTLPGSGVAGMRLSDVLGVLVAGAEAPDPRQVGSKLARAMVWRTVRLMTGRVGRLVPVVASGVSAVDNARRVREVGARMAAVYGQLAELPARLALVEDAVEV